MCACMCARACYMRLYPCTHEACCLSYCISPTLTRIHAPYSEHTPPHTHHTSSTACNRFANKRYYFAFCATPGWLSLLHHLTQGCLPCMEQVCVCACRKMQRESYSGLTGAVGQVSLTVGTSSDFFPVGFRELPSNGCTLFSVNDGLVIFLVLDRCSRCSSIGPGRIFHS